MELKAGRDSKNFSVCLPVETEPPCRFMKVEALFIFAALLSAVSLRSVFTIGLLQPNSRGYRNPDIIRRFMARIAPL